MDFEWDDSKARRNLAKHRISFEEAVTIFSDPRELTIYTSEIADRRLPSGCGNQVCRAFQRYAIGMTDFPDIYADGFSVTAGRFGVTLTLLRSEPTGEAGAHDDPREIVGRIRLSPNLAKAIAEALGKTLVAASRSTQRGDTTTH